MHSDSSACRGIMLRTGPGRLKHLQTRFLWLQGRVRANELGVCRVLSEENPADLGTKVLDEKRIAKLRVLCRIVPSRAFATTVAALVVLLAQGAVAGRASRIRAARKTGAGMTGASETG